MLYIFINVKFIIIYVYEFTFWKIVTFNCFWSCFPIFDQFLLVRSSQVVIQRSLNVHKNGSAYYCNCFWFKTLQINVCFLVIPNIFTLSSFWKTVCWNSLHLGHLVWWQIYLDHKAHSWKWHLNFIGQISYTLLTSEGSSYIMLPLEEVFSEGNLAIQQKVIQSTTKTHVYLWRDLV